MSAAKLAALQELFRKGLLCNWSDSQRNVTRFTVEFPSARRSFFYSALPAESPSSSSSESTQMLEEELLQLAMNSPTLLTTPTKTISYTKWDKIVNWEEDEPHAETNVDVSINICGGFMIQLDKRTESSLLSCISSPRDGIRNDDLIDELRWLANNQPGILRLIALFLKPHIKAYQDIADLLPSS